jgi:hypothetical protein
MELIELNFLGYSNIPSRCNVYVRNVGDDIHYLLFEDLGEGTSVTNMSEKIATLAVQQFGLNPNNCRFFETYRDYNHSIDEIEYTWNQKTDGKWVARMAKWHPTKLTFQLLTE